MTKTPIKNVTSSVGLVTDYSPSNMHLNLESRSKRSRKKGRVVYNGNTKKGEQYSLRDDVVTSCNRRITLVDLS